MEMCARVLFCVALALASRNIVFAQQTPNVTTPTCPNGQPSQGTLSVTGQGSATGTPDTANVILQVQTTKPTADEARIAAATATNATLAALQAINGISPTDITTTSISLQPNYVWDQGTQANKLTGYVFTQTLQVTVNNMTAELLGSVVDTAVKTGGNDLQVSSVDTSLSPSQELAVANEARKQAVANALSTASVLAQAAGVTMGPITSIADQTSATTPVPLPMQTGAAEKPVGANVSTPVSVGTQEVQASVGLVLALCSA